MKGWQGFRSSDFMKSTLDYCLDCQVMAHDFIFYSRLVYCDSYGEVKASTTKILQMITAVVNC